MGMIKIIAPGSQDLVENAVQMIKVAKTGLRGQDLKDFIKRAGHEFADIIKRTTFDPGEVPIHLIALGAGEHYGSNRNGDFFGINSCRKYHDTFVKHARWFRNHVNKDKSKSYGIVKHSMFNEPMKRIELLVFLNGTKAAAEKNGGLIANTELEKLADGKELPVSMACFPAGTPILCADGQEREIDKLELGDEVITHHGNTGIVDQLMMRQYTGDMIRFRASGLPDDIVCTSNHKIWVRPQLKGKASKCPVCCKQFKSLNAHLWQKKDAQHQAAYKDYSKYAEGWVPADQLTVGDYVRTPLSTEITELGDPAYAELLGYYLAEGSTFYANERTGIDFSFHRDEVEFANRVVELLHQFGYTRTKIYIRKNNVRLVRVISPELVARLEIDGGRYSWAKQVNKNIMTWAPETQAQLLSAFLNGDGHFSKIHKNLIGTTVSRQLAFQLATICWRLNIPARVNAYQSKKSNKRKAYTVIIQQQFVDKLTCDKVPVDFSYALAARPIGHLKHQAVGQTWVGCAGKTLSYVEHSFVYHRIMKVIQEDYSGPVYNIAVSPDSSYVARYIGASNCRVPFDVCSYCGNKARNRSEYCKGVDEGGMCKGGGLKNRITTVLSNGHILHADNPDPDFFDISNVHRPADRIAYVFGKTANNTVKSGAELAEELGVTAPINVLINAYNGEVGELIKCAYVLAEAEKEATPVDWSRAFDSTVQPPIEGLASLPKQDHGKTLSAFAMSKIALPVREFLRLITSNDNCDELSFKVAQYLPGIFSRLIASNSLETLLSNNPYRGSFKELAPLNTRQWAAKYAADFSIEQLYINRRIMLSALRNPNPLNTIKTATTKSSPNLKFEKLAVQYALYKIALLYDISDNDDDLQLTANLLVQQNQVN